MANLQLRKAHKKDNADLAPKAIASIPDPDFLPFVCHYDPSTILTKNGELMRVIRIVGFNHESISSELVNLRETVRDAISKHIKTNEFALWIHTIRRRKNIAPNGTFDDYFSSQLDQIWEEKNNWKNQYVNELYLTIIIQGYDTSITNINSLLRSFSMGGTKHLHQRELEKSYKILKNISDKVLEEVDGYGAKLLGIKEWEGVLYSEPMRFFGKIVNLCEDKYPLTINDMSEDLAGYRIAFGNSSLEVVGQNKKHFAAMFSVKEYQEISVAALDKFLQLPQEFIITQSVDFIDRNKALMAFEYQNYILDISGDEQLKQLSGLDNIIESDSGANTDYGEQQITIMLINETTGGLQEDIISSLEKFHDLGLVAVREDIFSEHCFWSQLPGNFKFLRRQKPINTSRVAGFASLHNFPAGSREGNYWGDAVTIFRTVLGTPYFFNFHNGDNGHTMIIGPLGSGKTVMLNFLVSQSRKFKNKLFYFDHDHSGRVFIEAIAGNNFIVTKNKEEKALQINPLNLPNTPENIQFLSSWFKYLVHYGKDEIPPAELELIPEIVTEIIRSNIKKLSTAAEFFNKDRTRKIHEKLEIWHSSGKCAFIFDHEDENDLQDNLVNAFDLTSIVSQKSILVPIISYLLYKIELSLDGKPTIIVLDEAWKLLDNYAIGPGINDWLARLRKKNCVVIFATESVEEAGQSNITNAINQDIVSSIFLPDSEPSEYYKTVFGLSGQEFGILSSMSNENRHFLLKQNDDAVIATLDLSGAGAMINILSSDSETTLIVEEIRGEFGQDPKDWVPKFLEVVEELEKEALEEERLGEEERLSQEKIFENEEQEKLEKNKLG